MKPWSALGSPPAEDMSSAAEAVIDLCVLSPTEVQKAAGDYKRPADQLRELHRRGFWRAYRSKLTGKVVLERPHYDAVCRGIGQAANDAHQPKLRKPKR